MSEIETNIFAVLNGHDLRATFRRCLVTGLRREHDDYYRNRDRLHAIARIIKRPVTVEDNGQDLYLIVPDNAGPIPAEFGLVGCTAQIEPQQETFTVNFGSPELSERPIALNFLRFALERALNHNKHLWRPGAGRAFYERTGNKIAQTAVRYDGFKVRPILAEDGGLSLCVDLSLCHTALAPISAQLNSDNFSRDVKGRKFIYHFGDIWYEVYAAALADRNAEKYAFVTEGRTRHLLEYVLEQAAKPISPELAQLRGTESVILYPDAQGNDKAAISTLCYQVLGSYQLRSLHTKTLLDPRERLQQTKEMVLKHLTSLSLDAIPLKIASSGRRSASRNVQIPDLAFGNNQVLTLSHTPGATQVDLRDLGKMRMNMLLNPRAGAYVNDPLDRQIFVMPRSVHDSFGKTFIADLSADVGKFMPNSPKYDPDLIIYDDTGRKRFAGQAQAIRTAIENARPLAGYAIAMIHRSEGGRARVEDPLAAYIAQYLRDQWDLKVSVMHTDVLSHGYQAVRAQNGDLEYRIARESESRVQGYLRNVALNHVLINNHRWPFILHTPLHADITIGLDIKNNTCGLLAVGRNGKDIRFRSHTSQQKERLQASQTSAYLAAILREEASSRGGTIRSVAIHRDGRLFPSERRGIDECAAKLKREGVLEPNADVSVLEISKSAPTPVRLFASISRHNGSANIVNPKCGVWLRIDDAEAYICTTGFPFLRQGTANPLHIKRTMGTRAFGELVSDIFALSCLAWTQPLTCSRYPITIRLNDRLLQSEAGAYDEDELAISDLEQEGAA